MRRFPSVRRGRRLPEAVHVELVDLLFGAPAPILIVGAVAAAIGALIAARTGDPSVAALTVVALAVSLARMAVIMAYRRGAPGRRRSDARSAERRYAAGSLLFSLTVGALNARAVWVGDELVHMLVTGLMFGYGAGLVTRVAVRPSICAASLLLATVPATVALAAQLAGGGLDHALAYAAQATMIALFVLTSLHTMLGSYRTTVSQLTTKRAFSDLARQDALTGLPNRLLLRERFEADMVRVGGGGMLALHFLDLDRFKPVNDQHGHPVGDALLQAVAERLKRMLRSDDTVARLGGDEFVVVQTGIAHPDEARMLAHRIVRTIGAPYRIGDHEVVIGTSVGIALAPGDGKELEQLAARADEALYRAKTSGRGAVAFWSDGAEVLPAQPPIAAVA